MPQTQQILRLPIKELQIGDLVDLENDPFADPDHSNPMYPFEYQTICAIEVENPDCICVYFDGSTCGFPTDHMVSVQRDVDQSPSEMNC